MAGEYQGASYGYIAPQVDLSSFVRLRQQQRQAQMQQQRIDLKLQQDEEKQNDALARYAQTQTDSLVKKIDPKNPYNALLTTGLYDLKKKVTDFINQGGVNDAEVVNLINSGATDVIDLNNRWNSRNAAIDQNSQAVKALGLDPKEVAAKAREIAFYTKDKNGKLTLDLDKLKNTDPDYDPVQDVYKNHADELALVKPFGKITWSKVNPSANDVYDPQTGDLVSTKTFMNFIPGLHRPTLKDGKPYIGKVGEVQMVDVDEQGNETPLTHTIQVLNGKTGKTENKTAPLMGVSDEAYASIVANSPQAEVYANQKLSAENRKLREDNLPELTDEKAAAFKRAAIYDAIPQPMQPMQSTENLSARSELMFSRSAALKRVQFNLDRALQLDPQVQDAKLKNTIITNAGSWARSNYAGQIKELDAINNKRVKTADDDLKAQQLQQEIDGGTYQYLQQYIKNTPGVVLKIPEGITPVVAPVQQPVQEKPKTWLQQLFPSKTNNKPGPGQKSILKGTIR